MSDDTDHVVALDVPTDRQAELAAAVTEWLRASGWGVPTPDGGLALGPTAGPDADPSDRIVVHSSDWGGWSAFAGETGPVCRSCGTAVGEADEDVIAWAEGAAPEPTFTCLGCGRVARAGDMDVSGGTVHGNPGVSFSPEFDEPTDVTAGRLRDALTAAFGGRWVHVHEHL